MLFAPCNRSCEMIPVKTCISSEEGRPAWKLTHQHSVFLITCLVLFDKGLKKNTLQNSNCLENKVKSMLNTTTQQHIFN